MPPERVAGLIDAVRHLREATDEPSHPSLDRLADDLGSETGTETQAVEVSAPRTELRELILVAIDEAGEMLAHACSELLRGGGSPGALRSRLAEVRDLVDLLDVVTGADERS